MELKQIEYFLQVAQLQHVSQAADFLNISQPTLSKSLASLERSLGAPLFDRVGNRLRLNASGQSFYTYAKQAMQMLDTASLTAKQSVFEVAGNISIICLSFAPIILPCISEYVKLNPQINIQILQYNHNLNRASDEDYDFVLSSAQDEVISNQNSQLWVTQPLFSEDCLFVIGPNHPQYAEICEDNGRVDLTQFSNARFVTMRLDSNFVDYTYPICQNAGFFPKSYLQTDDFLVKMNLIREGIAVAFLPAACLNEAELLCPGLRALKVNHCNVHRTVLMMRKKKSLLSEAALDFWDFVMEYFHLPKDERE